MTEWVSCWPAEAKVVPQPLRSNVFSSLRRKSWRAARRGQREDNSAQPRRRQPNLQVVRLGQNPGTRTQRRASTAPAVFWLWRQPKTLTPPPPAQLNIGHVRAGCAMRAGGSNAAREGIVECAHWCCFPCTNEPCSTRACNLWFRRLTPYPFGHRAKFVTTSPYSRVPVTLGSQARAPRAWLGALVAR